MSSNEKMSGFDSSMNGFPLSEKVENKTIYGKKLFSTHRNFDLKITIPLIKGFKSFEFLTSPES